MQDEASYICDACGDEIVIPVDPSMGMSQQFVEDVVDCSLVLCQHSIFG